MGAVWPFDFIFLPLLFPAVAVREPSGAVLTAIRAASGLSSSSSSSSSSASLRDDIETRRRFVGGGTSLNNEEAGDAGSLAGDELATD